MVTPTERQANRGWTFPCVSQSVLPSCVWRMPQHRSGKLNQTFGQFESKRKTRWKMRSQKFRLVGVWKGQADRLGLFERTGWPKPQNHGLLENGYLRWWLSLQAWVIVVLNHELREGWSYTNQKQGIQLVTVMKIHSSRWLSLKAAPFQSLHVDKTWILRCWCWKVVCLDLKWAGGPGCLGYIGDCTTQICGDHNKPIH